MGVWVRWMVTALGLLLAGCENNITRSAHLEMPQSTSDYIEVGSAIGMNIYYSKEEPVEFSRRLRIYSNDLGYYLFDNSDIDELRNISAPNLYEDVLRMLNDNEFESVPRLSRIYSNDRCAGITHIGATWIKIYKDGAETRYSYRCSHPEFTVGGVSEYDQTITLLTKFILTSFDTENRNAARLP